ncbi:hypothetical protein [Fimbriimonas ginsengisoli]|uniref:DUF4261 domain-containing protein n=1 Tax=Fimbriimonas ginsengisoli Gsoil 348 TaxID=661478 RepID=A0A068NIP9_FIMGI|nr:hypothetical protein [Fimbriimonas ginsengisoli]AIE83406.1 hypothetical protein OP10G_0038 [Fimbriimonas ginsengisoli Gsoil 348]
MRPWQFSRPKGPGFEIGQSYYLSVLCSSSVLPSIVEIVNPKGEGGAMEGFGAPLAGDSADRTILHRPLERGTYVVASKDRKTVIRLVVISKEEAGFDPEAFAQSAMSATANPEMLARLRGTWNLAQLVFESFDPLVYPALDLFLGVAARIASLGEGVVADAVSQRYLLPDEVFHVPRLDPRVDARDHVSVGFRVRPDGRHAFTMGMRKFNLPEHEILNLFEEDLPFAEPFLLALAEKVLLGDLTRPGDQFGVPKLSFEARDGGFDQELWQGTPVYELLPPTSRTPGECLRAWATEVGIV